MDPAQPQLRALLSFAAIVGGTALACCTGGIAAGGAIALAGIFGNVFAADLSKLWDERRRDPKYRHQNVDLTRLVGDSIALVLYECSADRDLSVTTRGWCKSLAEVASGTWQNIAEHPNLAQLRSDNLPELFTAAANQDRQLTVFEIEDWLRIIDLLSSKAELKKDQDARNTSAHRLHIGIFNAVREMFKRDLGGERRAYAALSIDMNAMILATLCKVAQNQQSVLASLRIQHGQLREIRTQLDLRREADLQKLTKEQTRDLTWLVDEIRTISASFDDVAFRIWRIKKDTTALLDGQANQVILAKHGHTLLARISVGLLALWLLVTGAMFLHFRQLTDLRQVIVNYLADKQSGVNPNQRPIPPEVLKASEQLMTRGDAFDKAQAAVASGKFDEADKFIQSLEPEAIQEAFKLCTLKGDRYYFAGEFDKAIEPYDQAFVLRPSDITARNNLAVAHAQARLGDIAVHRRRAIEISEGTLKRLLAGSIDWATTQSNLGNAWSDMPTGDSAENLGKAITAYEAALTVRTKEAHPIDWAATQNNLGTAWRIMPIGDPAENLHKAINAYQVALTVRTKEAHPIDWAATKNNLGNAWSDMPSSENLHRAIAAYEEALTVYTKDAHPVAWAMTENNLGVAWQNMPTGNRGENLRRAIAAFEEALTVRTKAAQPVDWAATKNNLGIAWRNMPIGVDRNENIGRAITAYEEALTVYTRDGHPVEWAMTQYNLGNAWQSILTGDRGENLSRAVAAYEAALTVRTKDAYPVDWAMTQNNLATVKATLAELPGQPRCELLRRAIASEKGALLVRTHEAFPTEYADTQNNLAIDMDAYRAAGCESRMPIDAIEPAS